MCGWVGLSANNSRRYINVNQIADTMDGSLLNGSLFLAFIHLPALTVLVLS